MQKLLYAPFITGRAGTGLLFFRVMTGIALMWHGADKIVEPFSWMDKMHPGFPAFLQFCAAFAEFGGGLMLVLGLLTPLACVLISITMVCAIFMVHVPQGGNWIGGPHAYEAAASYLINAITLFLTGPGAYSLDAKLFGHSKFIEPVVVKEDKQTVGTRS